ncbi:hypothetical protein E2562_005038 [Oryza meyeriana var. granulata]|uniref:Uncharacterized protein n=1 Tax=Oryza meyeriana var. granulata TaxID=110450 RepID=A0A6G1BSF6_9ORYZ|nr:hypothetical protein E2562_005038 [Oryza meyeriana var. granulata]
MRDSASDSVARLSGKPKSKGIKGWSIWGLLHKKSNGSAFGGSEPRVAAPELRARGTTGRLKTARDETRQKKGWN